MSNSHQKYLDTPETRSILVKSDPLVSSELLTLPSDRYVLDGFDASNRSDEVITSLTRIFNHGRLGGTGYLSILPVDQGLEHTAGYSFVENPNYFNPENVVTLAIEGGCNAIASSFGLLGLVSDKYADQIPFIVKLNHNERLIAPNLNSQTPFGLVEDAYNMGAAAVGATIYFGGEDSRSEIAIVAEMFALAHELGMATVLWCYVRNKAFTVSGKNVEAAADLTGQANHIGVTLQADIIKQKLPNMPDGISKLRQEDHDYAKYDPKTYQQLIGTDPVDMTRYQVLNCFSGRIPMISSGGESSNNDFEAAVNAAVTNKRAGGAGLIMGRKAFKRDLKSGTEILNAVQDVYLDESIRPA